MDNSELVAAQQRLPISFVGDLVCPWCRLAFHRSRQLAQELPIQIVWHPFLLNPHLPPHGVPRRSYLERKFGGAGPAVLMMRRAAANGAREGLRFAFDRIHRQPETTRAHALVLAAEAFGRTIAVAVDLLDAFFENGIDLGDVHQLARLAARHGIGPAELSAALAPQRLVDVRTAHNAAVARGIEGVPTLLLPRLGGIAGAQPMAVLRAAIETALLANSPSSRTEAGDRGLASSAPDSEIMPAGSSAC